MIQILEVQDLIDRTMREAETAKALVDSDIRNGYDKSEKSSKKMYNKIVKRFDYYKMIKAYLKTGPTKEFIQNEYDRVTNRISMIGLNFSHDSSLQNLTVIKKLRSAYEKEIGVPKLREQQKCLKFILGK